VAATIKDVARESGVAVCTVSFAMNGSAHVAEKTKKRIFETIERLNYRPNQSARGLVTKKTNNIGLAVQRSVDEMEGTVLSDLIKGMGKAANQRNYDLVLSFQGTFKENKDDDHVLDVYRKRSADGLMLMGSKIGERPYKELVKQRFPFVLLGRPYKENVCHSVNADNVEATYQAIRNLIDSGHRRIAFITPCSIEYEVASDRLEGYIKAMSEAGIEIDEELIAYGSFEENSGLAEAEALLKLPNPPTAILAGRDMLALRVLDVAKQRGVKVPEQLAIVGCENSLMAQGSHPSITSIDFMMRDIGYLAANLLIDLIEGVVTYDDIQRIIVPHTIYERESSRRSMAIN
jgi:LacI family transcriptional regulator